MQTNHKVLSRYYAVVCGGWQYLVLIELDLAVVVNSEHVSSIKTDDGIGSKESFVNVAKYKSQN